MAKNVSEKISELKTGVDWFYSDEFKLEEAGEKYKELTKLAKEIEKDLAEMKNEINVIAEDFSTIELWTRVGMGQFPRIKVVATVKWGRVCLLCRVPA